MTTILLSGQPNQVTKLELNFLDAEQLRRIDKALAEMAGFGEVRLVKMKGKLRFIQKLESESFSGGYASSLE